MLIDHVQLSVDSRCFPYEYHHTTYPLDAQCDATSQTTICMIVTCPSYIIVTLCLFNVAMENHIVL